MNWIDALIIIILVWFSYAAFHAGLIREVVTILGAIFAVALAGLFYTDLAKDVDVAINNTQTSEIVAFGMIFGAVVLASQLIGMFMKQAASMFMLGLFDAMGGAFIGFLKGFIFVEIGLIVAITYPSLGLSDAVHNSAIAPLFLDLLPVLEHILPGKFKIAIQQF